MTTDREQRWQRVLAFAGLWLLAGGGALGSGLRRARRDPQSGCCSASRSPQAQLSCSAGRGSDEGCELQSRRPSGPVEASLVRPGGPVAASMLAFASWAWDSALDASLLRAKATAEATPGRTRVLLVSGSQADAATYYRLSGLTSKALRIDPSRHALRLNEHGALLRRRGSPERAAEQHRVALAIVRDLGDKRAEAMTLNNLALALAQGGAGRSRRRAPRTGALSACESSATRSTRDRSPPISACVRRRQGRSEEAVTPASTRRSDKLPPESPAYRQVEEELSAGELTVLCAGRVGRLSSYG